MAFNPTRRSVLKGLGAAGAVGAASSLGLRLGHAQTGDGPRYLIVLAATGGASIIDGPLAIRASQSANASPINCYPDGLVQQMDGLPFTAIDGVIVGIQ